MKKPINEEFRLHASFINKKLASIMKKKKREKIKSAVIRIYKASMLHKISIGYKNNIK